MRRITRVTICILAVISLALMFSLVNAEQPGQMKMMEKPGLEKMQPPAMKPIPKIKEMCPDPAVVDLHAELVSMTDLGKGRVKIVGVIKNIGSVAYESNPNQQYASLDLLYNFGPPQHLATQSFQNLTPGQEVKLVYELDWTTNRDDVTFPTKFVMTILYDPDISSDGNPKNDDCNGSNNTKSLPVANVDAKLVKQ